MSSADVGRSGHSGESDRPPTLLGLAAMPLIGGHADALAIKPHWPSSPTAHPTPDDTEMVSECELSEWTCVTSVDKLSGVGMLRVAM